VPVRRADHWGEAEEGEDMLNEQVAVKIGDQIRKEMTAALFYLSASAYLEDRKLTGMAKWMRGQYEEELEHATRLVDYMLERGRRPRIQGIPEPNAEFGSPLAAFEAAREDENSVWRSINELHRMATEEGDYATAAFLQPYQDIQVEEDSVIAEIIDKLQIAGGDGTALLMLDREVGQKVA
jgi:ferritin